MIQFILTILPYGASYFLADSFLRRIENPTDQLPGLARMFYSTGLGLAFSACLTFSSFLFFNELNWTYTIGLHTFLCVWAVMSRITVPLRPPKKWIRIDNYWAMSNGGWLLLLIVGMLPGWIESQFFPLGGWDAWQVWNFKSRFLFLAQDQWQNIFDPALWRSSPHYPLLLPLINVWGWAGVQSPLPVIPRWTALLYTFASAGLVFSMLRPAIGGWRALTAAFLLLSLPFFHTNAASQYCDILVAFFIMGSVAPLCVLAKNPSKVHAAAAGLSVGFLSFSKPEGMIASLLIYLIGVGLLYRRNKKDPVYQTSLRSFIFWAILAALPAVIFQLFYSPGNQTFINGFTSPDQPATMIRLKMMLAFMFFEMKSAKWNGLLILLFVGFVLGGRRALTQQIRPALLFLCSYGFIIALYYQLNTYFEIGWWLQVTLNRIIMSIMPLAIFTVFLALFPSKKIPSD